MIGNGYGLWENSAAENRLGFADNGDPMRGICIASVLASVLWAVILSALS